MVMDHSEYQPISISIISHGHGSMVERLVADLLDCPEIGQVVLTCNVPETLTLPHDDRIMTLDNIVPTGFAANHNAAFRHCFLPYFCPLNPDIQLPKNPFPSLLIALQKTGAALVAPLVRNLSGDVEDSMRPFPTIRSLLMKAMCLSDCRYTIKDEKNAFYPEWVAGMFMLFRSADFRQLGGFDTRFFLYYEDVDICARAWKAGMKVLACPFVSVVHDARRESRRNVCYMYWHLTSMARYFLKYWKRLPSLPNGR